MRTKTKISLVFICIMAIMLYITLYMARTLDFGMKDIFAKTEIKSTKPYALKFAKTSRIKNITGSVDYYVSIKDKDKDNDRHYSGIYSFDISAGSDSTNNKIRQYQDSILFPYPTVTVDQNDTDPVLVIDEKGEFKWNDEIQPLKHAMEMMAKDYGRRFLTAESAVSLKDYFEQIDSTYKIGFYPNHPSTTFDISSELLPFDIRLFPDLLDHHLRPVCQDSIYTRKGIKFYDNGDEVMSISYLRLWDMSFDETKDYFENNCNYCIRFIDPFNPKEKSIYVDKKGHCAYIILDGLGFIANYRDDIYFSDVLYIISTICDTDDRQFPTRYQYWIDNYDDLIHLINKGQFKKAKLNLEDMKNLQPEHLLSKDEMILNAFLDVLTGTGTPCQTGDKRFDRIVAGYADIANNSAEGILKNKGERDSLLYWIHAAGNHENITENIERYLVSHKSESNCSEEDIKEYVRNLVQGGGILDEDIISGMDSETFLDYVENITYKSFRAISQDYENKDISDWLRSQELGKNIVVVKNCSEELESFYNERNTGDKKLVEKLIKRLEKQDINLNVENTAMYILLFPEDRSSLIRRSTDKDAVIFCKDSLYHVPNYSGITGKSSAIHYHYKDLEIDEAKGVINDKNKMFRITDALTIKICKALKEAYNTDPQSYIRELNHSMGEYVVWFINRTIEPVPFYYGVTEDYNYHDYIDDSVIPK